MNDPEKYIEWGPLGEAFQNEQRTIVLIDEIDKADIDFPNDLLLELDEQKFFVRELNKEIKAKKPPIIFITSNDEKDLPDAFLRRCVFHYIRFPGQKQLLDIMKAHFPGSGKDLIDGIIGYFMNLREKMEKDNRRKKVSTSELLDWFKVLRHYHPDDKILDALSEKFLYPGVLIKSWEDYQRDLFPSRSEDMLP